MTELGTLPAIEPARQADADTADCRLLPILRNCSAMAFDVPLTMYRACGKCGHTWSWGGMPSQVSVTTHDMAQAMVRSTVARLFGQPKRRAPRQERRLLDASLLRVRAVIAGGGSGPLIGHRIMSAHHGSARRNLSEDFGIAVAMSFAEQILACRDHYFLDANPNATEFGFPSGKRPDIGSVDSSGMRFLTEAKGSMAKKRLAARPRRVQPALLVKDSYQQLTGSLQASYPSPTRLFLSVASPIAAGRSVRLEAAEYVTKLTRPCTRCDFDGSNYNDEPDSTHLDHFESDWGRLALETYRHLNHLVDNRPAELDRTGQYHVFELVNAEVTIGLHRRIAEAVSNPESNFGDLQQVLDGLPAASIDPSDGRYADGTLTRANWPETELYDQDEGENDNEDIE